MPLKPAKATTLRSRVKRDRALDERYGQRPYMGQVYNWMMKASCGPEFGPPVRLERIRRDGSNRRALLQGDGQMQEFMGLQDCIGALDIHDRKPLEALEEALYWFPVERHNAVLTVAFIKATAVPFERRSPREHEVVALYWQSGLSLDAVMKFEDGKATLAELERAPRQPEIHSKSPGVWRKQTFAEMLNKGLAPPVRSSRDQVAAGHGKVRQVPCNPIPRRC